MELYIENDFVSRTTNFYMEIHKDGQKTFIAQRDGELIYQPVDPLNGSLTPIFPLLKMDQHLADQFIKQVVDYASRKGLPTINENLLQGKLSATEKHLDHLINNFDQLLKFSIFYNDTSRGNNLVQAPNETQI